jgi:AcrR family transcriptional regulator
MISLGWQARQLQRKEAPMPAAPRTSTEAVIAAARGIVEREGLAALTMQSVATEVGVRAPSLYKRVRDRAALVRLVADQVALELADRLDRVTGGGDARADLRSVAAAFREFARANPASYTLMFDPRAGGTSPEVRDRSAAAVLRVATALAGPDDALSAARLVTAWASGFAAMELAGAFQLGGDVDAAWEYAVEHLVAAVSGGPTATSGSR